MDLDGIEDHYDSDDDGDGFNTVEAAYGSNPRDATWVNAPPSALLYEHHISGKYALVQSLVTSMQQF